ncbi:class II glutamine amidotransferase [Pirellulales bacterium]|nr:class II glutamine amidotransferase [Pirellulales bacterium]
MTSMLQSMKHRGPDSTGFAVYGLPKEGELVVRLKVAEREDFDKGFDIRDKIKQRKAEVNRRIMELGGEILAEEQATDYAWLFRIRYTGELRKLADYIEDIEGAEILSIGSALELIKDLGDAKTVSSLYELDRFEGTHAIGHVRMATESDVDICSAHPYWAYPFGDISVVHNGQLTNYWSRRRALERKGYRFMSDCDSELIAVYIAGKLESGASLEEAMRQSINELDGVFTYLVATRDALGMAKDMMSAKPMVLYEGEDVIALASEEIAIRAVFPHEIDTVDPYAGEVHVWQKN